MVIVSILKKIAGAIATLGSIVMIAEIIRVATSGGKLVLRMPDLLEWRLFCLITIYPISILLYIFINTFYHKEERRLATQNRILQMKIQQKKLEEELGDTD